MHGHKILAPLKADSSQAAGVLSAGEILRFDREPSLSHPTESWTFCRPLHVQVRSHSLLDCSSSACPPMRKLLCLRFITHPCISHLQLCSNQACDALVAGYRLIAKNVTKLVPTRQVNLVNDTDYRLEKLLRCCRYHPPPPPPPSPPISCCFAIYMHVPMGLHCSCSQ